MPDASQCMSDVTKVRSDAAKMSPDVIKTRVEDYIIPSDVLNAGELCIGTQLCLAQAARVLFTSDVPLHMLDVTRTRLKDCRRRSSNDE